MPHALRFACFDAFRLASAARVTPPCYAAIAAVYAVLSVTLRYAAAVFRYAFAYRRCLLMLLMLPLF